jgi:hypothetical protein
MAVDTEIGQHLCRAVASIFRELHPVRYLRSGTAGRSGLRTSKGSSASGRPMNLCKRDHQGTAVQFGEAQVCARKISDYTKSSRSAGRLLGCRPLNFTSRDSATMWRSPCCRRRRRIHREPKEAWFHRNRQGVVRVLGWERLRRRPTSLALAFVAFATMLSRPVPSEGTDDETAVITFRSSCVVLSRLYRQMGLWSM